MISKRGGKDRRVKETEWSRQLSVTARECKRHLTNKTQHEQYTDFLRWREAGLLGDASFLVISVGSFDVDLLWYSDIGHLILGIGEWRAGGMAEIKRITKRRRVLRMERGLGLMLMWKSPASWSFLKYEIKWEKYDIYIYIVTTGYILRKWAIRVARNKERERRSDRELEVNMKDRERQKWSTQRETKIEMTETQREKKKKEIKKERRTEIQMKRERERRKITDRDHLYKHRERDYIKKRERRNRQQRDKDREKKRKSVTDDKRPERREFWSKTTLPYVWPRDDQSHLSNIINNTWTIIQLSPAVKT